MSEEVPQYQTRQSIDGPTRSVPIGAAPGGRGSVPESVAVRADCEMGSDAADQPDGDAVRRVRIGDRVRLPIRYGYRATGVGPTEPEGVVTGFVCDDPVVASVVSVFHNGQRWEVPLEYLEVVFATAGPDERAQARDHTPFERGRRFVPAYYRPRRANRRIAADADPSDIGDAFALRPLRSIAIKYLVRAGYKPGQSAAKDLTKALEVIQRELEYLEVGGEDCPGRVEWDDVSGHDVGEGD